MSTTYGITPTLASPSANPADSAADSARPASRVCGAEWTDADGTRWRCGHVAGHESTHIGYQLNPMTAAADLPAQWRALADLSVRFAAWRTAPATLRQAFLANAAALRAAADDNERLARDRDQAIAIAHQRNEDAHAADLRAIAAADALEAARRTPDA